MLPRGGQILLMRDQPGGIGVGETGGLKPGDRGLRQPAAFVGLRAGGVEGGELQSGNVVFAKIVKTRGRLVGRRETAGDITGMLVLLVTVLLVDAPQRDPLVRQRARRRHQNRPKNHLAAAGHRQDLVVRQRMRVGKLCRPRRLGHCRTPAQAKQKNRRDQSVHCPLPVFAMANHSSRSISAGSMPAICHAATADAASVRPTVRSVAVAISPRPSWQAGPDRRCTWANAASMLAAAP